MFLIVMHMDDTLAYFKEFSNSEAAKVAAEVWKHKVDSTGVKKYRVFLADLL